MYSRLIILSLLFCTCAPSRFVKPLKKSEKAASFSFGGPVIQYAGAAIPIPFTTLAYAQGLSDKCTAFASLHTTSALFGNLQCDLGATFLLHEKENKFGFSAAPALQLAYSIGNKGTFSCWPSADVNWFWHPKSKSSYFYAGLNSWFELSGKKAHDQTQQRHFIPNLQLGYQVVKEKWQHQVEAKYLGAGIPNLPGVVGYVGAGGIGSFGIYYSLIRKF